MQDSINNLIFSENELAKYGELGKKLNRTLDHELLMLKWLDNYIQSHGNKHNKDFIGVLGTLIFIQHDNEPILTHEDFIKHSTNISTYYNNNINMVDNGLLFKLSNTDKHYILIKNYKDEHILKLNV